MKKFLFFLILIFFCFTILFYWGIYLPKDFQESREKIFSIEKGQTLFQIAENLAKEDLIKSEYFFELYVLIRGEAKKLKAGEYRLSSSMNIPEIAKKIISGEIVKEKITIIEGWNLRDIGFYFENRGMFRAEEFWELVGFPLVGYSQTTDLPKPKDFSEEFPFLKDKPKNLGLEGYLFPDTYEIKKGETLEALIKKMLQNFDKKLTPELKEEITKQGKTIFEIITMASLIEKEVYNTKECPNCKNLVSGILWKRLENKIPLQVDATITYITGKKTTKISKQETQIDSPYNTYKYLGLPQGPICNPGLESILAALRPEKSEYWYYLSTPTGRTIFSQTLKDHNLAKEKYLK